MPGRRLLAAALAAALSTHAAPITQYRVGDDSKFLWTGRYLHRGDGSVVTDVEGASLSFVVANASFVGLALNDTTNGGAKLGVWMDTNVSVPGLLADPNPAGRAMPFLRVATLLTSSHVPLYVLGSGGQISGLVVRYTVQLLSEWQMIGGSGPDSVLAFVAIATDGVLLPAPARKTRRLVVLGDSLSSGVGCGFDRPANGAPCGDGVPVDDSSTAWGSVLCDLLDAECEVLAASGITIFEDKGYNLPLVFPYALGSMFSSWPAASRVAWGFAQHPADAILLELGENDEHASPPPTPAALAAAFEGFVETILSSYGRADLPIFLTIANHEAGQSSAMKIAVSNLVGRGVKATFLNATSPNEVNGSSIDVGCAGHPSGAQARLAAERAAPIVSAVLGW